MKEIDKSFNAKLGIRSKRSAITGVHSESGIGLAPEIHLGDVSGKEVLNIKLLFSHSIEAKIGTTERSLESS